MITLCPFGYNANKFIEDIKNIVLNLGAEVVSGQPVLGPSTVILLVNEQGAMAVPRRIRKIVRGK